MATAPQTTSHHSTLEPDKKRADQDQLRRDRYRGLLLMAIALAMLGLFLWLASLGGWPGNIDGLHNFVL